MVKRGCLFSVQYAYFQGSGPLALKGHRRKGVIPLEVFPPQENLLWLAA
jgi:hypothetical protein